MSDVWIWLCVIVFIGAALVGCWLLFVGLGLAPFRASKRGEAGASGDAAGDGCGANSGDSGCGDGGGGD